MSFCWAILSGSSLLAHPAYPVFLLVTCALMITISAHYQAMDRTRALITLAVSHSCLIDPNSFVLWKTLGSGAQFSVW